MSNHDDILAEVAATIDADAVQACRAALGARALFALPPHVRMFGHVPDELLAGDLDVAVDPEALEACRRSMLERSLQALPPHVRMFGHVPDELMA